MLLQTVPCESCACMADEEGGTSACAGTRRASVRFAVPHSTRCWPPTGRSKVRQCACKYKCKPLPRREAQISVSRPCIVYIASVVSVCITCVAVLTHDRSGPIYALHERSVA